MANGTLRVDVTTGQESLPVTSASISVRDTAGRIVRQTTTNANGASETLSLNAPDRNLSLNPNSAILPYAEYLIDVTADGFAPIYNREVQIFDGETSVLAVAMEPSVPSHPPAQTVFAAHAIPVQAPATTSQVVIPETVVVHLGAPSTVARNIRVPFIDYIKNVASSEIYPTWPLAALEANIYCQISFVLNRVYTEWYPIRGYEYTITNSTAYDQFFVEGRNIFSTISTIVDRIFNTYIRRKGYREPFFASFCNGTTTTCAGLSQWGSVDLAKQGKSAIEILRSYFPPDVELVTTNNVQSSYESYPGTPLTLGSSGPAVRDVQNRLNRIRVNYPLIPVIANPNGTFGAATQAAVTSFQQIFNLTADGIVGRATWNKIMQINASVRHLSALDSEGERMGIGTTPPTVVLKEGSRGSDVLELQFILDSISAFYPPVPNVSQTSVFDASTKAAVLAFQQKFGLTRDGVVGPATWQKLYEAYNAIATVTPPAPTPAPTPPPSSPAPAYPGTPLREGARGESVQALQHMINAVAASFPSIPHVSEDGVFGPDTKAAILAFQRQFGLTPDGVVGPATWNEMASLAQSLAAQSAPYPGAPLSEGTRGESVRTLQHYLNRAAAKFPSLPQVSEDGVYGPGTKAAVSAFQRRFGLTTDGVVGPVTWSYLSNIANS